jgi:hypothetical protein
MSDTSITDILAQLSIAIGQAGAEVNQESAEDAEKFLKAFPYNAFSSPEICVDPQEAVSFDWYLAKDRVFSLSFEPGSKLACAWLQGSDSGHFLEAFDGVTIPPKVTECLNRLYRH